MTSARILVEEACNHVQAKFGVLTRKGCLLQHSSFCALSDVTVVLKINLVCVFMEGILLLCEFICYHDNLARCPGHMFFIQLTKGQILLGLQGLF